MTETERRFVQVDGLSRSFPGERGGEALTVFEQVNFSIARGEFICVIGHSGCGKSTILNILAGLDQPSQGVALMEGREIAGPSLDRGVIFQNHSLLPWQSTLQNVSFAVAARHRDWSRAQVLALSRQYLDLVGLNGVEDRRPSQLSGGMRQRVGIARAFAIEPKLLLMDEPFGALDALTRGTIQDELVRICQQTTQTAFMITHDVDEAMLLADKILLMTNGPKARIAEIVEVSLPRPRSRSTVIFEPNYYPIRNHLVDFLVSRSKTFRDQPPTGYDPRHPPQVRPQADGSVAPQHPATSGAPHDP